MDPGDSTASLTDFDEPQTSQRFCLKQREVQRYPRNVTQGHPLTSTDTRTHLHPHVYAHTQSPNLILWECKNKNSGLGMGLNCRAFVWHLQGYGFKPQNHKKTKQINKFIFK